MALNQQARRERNRRRVATRKLRKVSKKMKALRRPCRGKPGFICEERWRGGFKVSDRLW